MFKKMFFSILLTLCACGCLYAQDLIVLANGNVIKAKVTKIENDRIKYKNYDNQDGPELTIFTRDILSINYENGTVQSFSADTPQASQQPQQSTITTPAPAAYSNNNETWKEIERQRLLSVARTWETIGDVLLALNIIGGIGAAIFLESWIIGTVIMCSGIGLGVICALISRGYRTQANNLKYIALMQHDFQLGNSTLTTSFGAITFNNMVQSSNGIALSAPAIGGGFSLRF